MTSSVFRMTHRRASGRPFHAIAVVGMTVAMSTLLGGCSADDALRPTGTLPAEVTLDRVGSAVLASIGDTAVLIPRVLGIDGTVARGVRLEWTTSPAGVVVPDGDGIFRAVGNGRVTITATVPVGDVGVRPSGYWSRPVADSVVIEVQQRPVRLALLPVDTAFATLGAIRQLRVQVTDARGHALLGTLPDVTWRAAQPGVLRVDSTGRVRSVAEGTGSVTVEAAGLTAARIFTVQPRRAHTSCMVFAQRRQTRQACVTLDFTMREREARQ